MRVKIAAAACRHRSNSRRTGWKQESAVLESCARRTRHKVWANGLLEAVFLLPKLCLTESTQHLEQCLLVRPFDCKWAHHHRVASKHLGRVAMLQLCSGSSCLVLQLLYARPVPECLRRLLLDPPCGWSASARPPHGSPPTTRLPAPWLSSSRARAEKLQNTAWLP
ncbi:hypothetical protein PR202_gb15006 [Eleusine coracana subsp. coracana]|uniref:Uncharacterized protein n=1 Tax=Eleusine coracana subsp. coracana TaxID=191504 RepID=A0AAV5EUF3_ELECO|nr:hypothetical protein PR202_gb15006 [Eleusine coracana subsp. coracana]